MKRKKMRGGGSVRQPMIYLRYWADDMRDRSDGLSERFQRARGWAAYHRPSFERLGDRRLEARAAWAGWPRANRYGFASGGVVGMTASGLVGLVLLSGQQALPRVVGTPSGVMEVGAGPARSPDFPSAPQPLTFQRVASSGRTPGDFNLRRKGPPVTGPPSVVPSAGIFAPLPSAMTASPSAPQVRPAPHVKGRPQPSPHAQTPTAPPPNTQAPVRPPQSQAPTQAPSRPPQAQAPSRSPQVHAPSRSPQAQASRPRPSQAQVPSRPPQAEAPRPRPPQAQAPSRPPQAEGPSRPPQAQGPKK